MGRQLRTRLDLMRPDGPQVRVTSKQSTQCKQPFRRFVPGQRVYFVDRAQQQNLLATYWPMDCEIRKRKDRVIILNTTSFSYGKNEEVCNNIPRQNHLGKDADDDHLSTPLSAPEDEEQRIEFGRQDTPQSASPPQQILRPFTTVRKPRVIFSLSLWEGKKYYVQKNDSPNRWTRSLCGLSVVMSLSCWLSYSYPHL